MLKVRLASTEDVVELFEWRNDPLSRKMLHSPEILDWDRHCDWLHKTLTNDARCLLMCVDERDTKVAVVRFDIEADNAVVGINLNPSMRGEGKGKQCLLKAISFFCDSFIDVKFLKAEIKDINIPSKIIFEALGFELQKIDSAVCYYGLRF